LKAGFLYLQRRACKSAVLWSTTKHKSRFIGSHFRARNYQTNESKIIFALEKSRKLADRAKTDAEFGYEPSAICRVEN
jgi:hypothetical protein